jgi:signal transduction histidine kinase
VRRLGLRTQLGVVAVFLAAYSASIGFSHLVEARTQARLEEAFQQDMAALTRLPRLGELVRHEALVSQQYLLTGRRELLAERARALDAIRRIEKELETLMPDPRERALWTELDGKLSVFLAEQEQWIARRSQGRLAPGAVVEILSRGEQIDGMLQVLLSLRDNNAAAVRAAREASRKASQVTLGLTLLTGLLVGGILVIFFSWFVIGPLTRLEEYARSWTLGSPWSLPAPQTGPEIESLFASMESLSRRLNEEYAKERDLAQFKSQLVSMVSHEFGNALSIISGAATILEETENEPDPKVKRAEYFQMLKANIQALGGSAQNLLNMGRLESGRFAIAPRKTALEPLARPCVQRLELLSLRKRQRVVLELPPEKLEVRADPESLSLVLTNLIGNAIKYTPEEGTIVVRAEADAADRSRVRVSVRDTGIGIKPEDRERIFSGFYRTEKGKATAGGFGVGLSLARRIVEAHDSELTVDSEPGKGSTFSFSLPLWVEAPLPQEAA